MYIGQVLFLQSSDFKGPSHGLAMQNANTPFDTHLKLRVDALQHLPDCV